MPQLSNARGAISTTSRVWLKVSPLRWAAGVVEFVSDVEVGIALDDGQRIKVPRGSDKVSQRTPKELESIDNLTSLPDLDEPNMLHSLNVRYLQSKIYTQTGPILVAMNPWTDLKVYGSDVLHSYRRVKLDHVPPHIYSIGEAAFANLQSNRKDQTILVSGDSGSGKTESTKFMMQYLAAVAHHTHTAHTEQKVLQCNPVLEAFGNAKTLRNDNSSRFGKYIDIHFDVEYALIGAKIDTYLLERSRVVGQQVGERNFHIFYQLTSQYNVDRELTEITSLLPAENFRYIQKGVDVSVGFRPANSFQNTRTALDNIGISENEREDIFKVLALVLHLGNLDFDADADDNAVLSIADRRSLTCARLMGVDVKRFANSLLSRQIQAGPQGLGDSYIVSQTRQQAVDSRDALARALYGNMFDALVRRINQALLQHRTDKIRTISILDIFGFEHFKSNHFEQFCINYANEKLQGHFNEFNFSLEIQEYEREQISWSFEDFRFQTNTRCIELIEGKRNGILSLLDEQCIVPNGNDETFCTKLKNELADHPYLVANKMKGTQFAIKHYAAEVVYESLGFCFKNKDPVQPAIVELITSGSFQYLRTVFSEHQGKMEGKSNGLRKQNSDFPKSSMIFESVTAQFKRQLSDLMGRISAAQPHFVRCINPNSQKAPGILEPEMILDQLRCSGLMEAVRVSRAGFPVRIIHSDFLRRFSLLTACPPGNDRTAATRMCADLYLPDEHYRVGATKVFMRREIYERLEEDRSRLLVRQTVCIQKVVRGHKARAYVKKLRILRSRAAIVLERLTRRTLVRRWYLNLLEKRQKLLALQQDPKNNSLANISLVSQPSSRVKLGSRNTNQPSDNQISPPARQERERSQIPTASPMATIPMSPNVVEQLEEQLGSVRELYYNERESQLALANLVKEVCTIHDENTLLMRIMDIDAKISSQVEEPKSSNSNKTSLALSRRIDTLSACKLLLQEKWNLVRQFKQAQAHVAMAQAQAQAAIAEAQKQAHIAMNASVQAQAAQKQIAQVVSQCQSAHAQASQSAAQLQSMSAEHARVVAELRAKIIEESKGKDNTHLELTASIKAFEERLEFARQELKSKDVAIIAMHNELVEAKEKYSNSPQDREELLNRIQELELQNKALKSVTGKGPDGDAYQSDEKAQMEQVVRDLEARAVSLETGLLNERKERESEFELMDANVRSRDERIKELVDRCIQLEKNSSTSLLSEAERTEMIAKQLDGLLESLESSVLPKGVSRLLHIKVAELSEEQTKLLNDQGREEGKVRMVSAVRHLTETYYALLARLLGEKFSPA